MKKIISAVIAAALLPCAAASADSATAWKLTSNPMAIELYTSRDDTISTILPNCTVWDYGQGAYLPAYEFSKALGYETEFTNDEETLTISAGARKIVINADSKEVEVDGKAVRLSMDTHNTGDMYLPISAIEDVFGFKAEYREDIKLLKLTATENARLDINAVLENNAKSASADKPDENCYIYSRDYNQIQSKGMNDTYFGFSGMNTSCSRYCFWRDAGDDLAFVYELGGVSDAENAFEISVCYLYNDEAVLTRSFSAKEKTGMWDIPDEQLPMGERCYLKISVKNPETRGIVRITNPNEAKAMLGLPYETPLPEAPKELIVSAENGKVSMSVSGNEISFIGGEPFIDENGRTQAPVRSLANAIGARVDYRSETGEGRILKGDKSVSFKTGSTELICNGETTFMDTPARIVEDYMYVPARYIAEALGMTVVWK